ncbi:hypothetical protein FQZ97_880600 [compost metagenome]
MMYHLVVSAQFGVLIFQGIETVGAGRNNLLYCIPVQYLDVLLGQHLESKFVSRPAGRVARTGLFRAKHRKTDIEMVQYLYKCTGYFLVAVVK